METVLADDFERFVSDRVAEILKNSRGNDLDLTCYQVYARGFKDAIQIMIGEC